MKRKIEILHPISSKLSQVYDEFLDILIRKEKQLQECQFEVISLANHIIWIKQIDDFTQIFQNIVNENPALKSEKFFKFELRILEKVKNIDNSIEQQIQFCEKYGQTKEIITFYGLESPQLVQVDYNFIAVIFNKENLNYKHISLFLYNVGKEEFSIIGKNNVQNYKVLSDCSREGTLYLITQQKNILQIVKYLQKKGKLVKIQVNQCQCSKNLQQIFFEQKRNFKITNYDSQTIVILSQLRKKNDVLLIVWDLQLELIQCIPLQNINSSIDEIEVKFLEPFQKQNHSLLIIININQQIYQIQSNQLYAANQYQNAIFKCILDLKQHQLNLKNISKINEEQIKQMFLIKLVEFIPPFHQLIKFWNCNDQDSIKFLLLENLFHLNSFAEQLVLSVIYSLKNNPVLALDILRYIDLVLHLSDLEDQFQEILQYIWNYLPGIILPKQQTFELSKNPNLMNILSWAEEKTRQNLEQQSDQLIMWIFICKQADKMHFLKLK